MGMGLSLKHTCMPAVFFLLVLFVGHGSNAGSIDQSNPAPAAAGEAQQGGFYRAPLLNNPPTLDPAYIEDIYAIRVIHQIFDGLVQFTPDLLIIPALAENWQVEEAGRVYRFFLRKDAFFHNGDPVTSDDVIFSLSRLIRVTPPPAILSHLLKISGSKEYLDGKSETIAGLQKTDDHTLIIRLEEPYVPFLVALGMYQAKIVPRKALGVLGENSKAFGKAPLGSGPFKFVSWKENESIRLEGFSDYYGGRPFLKGIEYRIYPGIQVEDVWADFQNGELDEMPVYGQIRDSILERKDLQRINRSSLSLQFYGINCENPRFRNPEVRRALLMAVDRSKLVNDVYKGQVQAARSILPPGLPGYVPQEDRLPFDPEMAARILEKALGGNLESLGTVEIVSNSQSPIAQAELNFIRECWARIGVRMEPKFIPDWSQFERYVKSDALQMYRYAWFADIPDPDDFLRPLFSSGSQTNFMRFRDAEVERLLQKAVGVGDPIERAGIYREIEEKILRQAPIIPLLYMSIDMVFQPTVHGIQASALGAHNLHFHRVWLGAPSAR